MATIVNTDQSSRQSATVVDEESGEGFRKSTRAGQRKARRRRKRKKSGQTPVAQQAPVSSPDDVSIEQADQKKPADTKDRRAAAPSQTAEPQSAGQPAETVSAASPPAPKTGTQPEHRDETSSLSGGHHHSRSHRSISGPRSRSRSTHRSHRRRRSSGSHDSRSRSRSSDFLFDRSRIPNFIVRIVSPTAGELLFIQLLLTSCCIYLLNFVSDSWWLTGTIVYLPKTPLIVGLLGFALLACRVSQRTVLASLGLTLTTAGLISDFQLPSPETLFAPADATDLRVVTVNVAEFEDNFAHLISGIMEENPDVIAFQEASKGADFIEGMLPGWHHASYDEFWVASRYPVTLIDACEPKFSTRPLGILVSVDSPQGPFKLLNVHQSSIALLLEKIPLSAITDGTVFERMDRVHKFRESEAAALRSFTNLHKGDSAAIVCGDFNMPRTSTIMQRYWFDFTSAFEHAGFGLGATAPCRKHPYWIDDLPWLKIDHILAGKAWTVTSAKVLGTTGSDHRPVLASMRIGR